MTLIVIPDVPLGPTEVPLIGQLEAVFSDNAQINLVYQAALPANLNTSITQMNSLAGQLNDTLTITEILNDSELFALPPNAPVKIVGLRANTLVGTLIDTAGISGQRGLVLHEPSTGGWWGYTVSSTYPTGYHGVLISLLPDAPVLSFGGYSEPFTSSISSIDASQFNVVKEALSTAKTMSFINVPTGGCYTCSFSITDPIGDGSISFPPMTKFPAGTQPTLTLNGLDEFYLRTFGEMVADPGQGGAMVIQWYCSYIQNFGVPA